MRSAVERTADTIAAIATPPGPGAIGVVKVSGPEAFGIGKRLFRPRKARSEFASHRLYYGHIVDPETREPVDEVLVAFMKAPHTYTREDVVEIYAHSGYRVLTRILELVLKCGARLAEPGEFTRRAFLNGRIDLAQAEAVQELVTAKTDAALRMALSQLSGKLSQEVRSVREEVLQALAVVEAAVDFPDEDIEIMAPSELAERLKERAVEPVERLLKAFSEGKVYREGLSVVLAGRPNVGKSSLLNALLKEDRAIVTPIPGTTRDVLEETAFLAGLPVRLVDTAGLRDTEDPVESIGVAKAKEKLSRADCVVFLVDATEAPDELTERLYEMVKERAHIVAVNKADIASEEDIRRWKERFPSAVVISAKEGLGLEELSKRIFEKVTGGRTEPPLLAPNLRQKDALEKAREALLRAVELLNSPQVLPELVAVELRDALSFLGEITGETTTEDLLDRIFSTFCIGK